MHYENKCIGCGKCFEVCPKGAHKIKDGKHIIDRTLCVSCGKCAANCFAEALVMSSRAYTVDEVMDEIRQDKLYYDESGGGVTVSGGEASLHADFIIELARRCHAEGISIAIESNMFNAWAVLEPLLRESIQQKLSGQDGADAGELLSAFAFDAHSLEKILEDVAQRVKETGESVFSAVTESVSHSIAYGIVYAAAFIAILLVVWLLLKPLDLAGKLPLVRTVNALGGALLGLVWAVLLLFAAVWLMQRFNWVVTPELIRDSILLKFFAENNPIGLIAAL